MVTLDAARDDTGETDAIRGDADGGRTMPFEVAAPDIPWLEDGAPPVARPVLTPCPDGWYETELAGETICEPWPVGGAQDCPPGEAHLIGAAGCEPLGGPCPIGDFAEDLPPDRPTLYVLEGAAAGGDGSLGSPHATLAEVLAQSPAAGTVVVLGKGRYEGTVMPPGLTLWGACPKETVVTAPAAAEHALEIREGSLELHRLAIAPAPARGLYAAGAGTTVTLRSVEVRGAACRGIHVVDEASLDAEELVVRDTRGGNCADPLVDAAWGIGLLETASSVQVRQSLITHNGEVGVMAAVGCEEERPTDLVLEDVVIRDHQGSGEGTPPHAVWAGYYSTFGCELSAAPIVAATVRRALVEANAAGGLFFRGGGTTVHVDQLLARDNGSQDAARDTFVAQPLSVADGAALQLSRATVTGARSYLDFGAIDMPRAGTSTLEDVVIANNRSRGLRVAVSRAGLAMRRIRMAGNLVGDIRAWDASVDLEDARLGASPLRERLTATGFVAASGALSDLGAAAVSIVSHARTAEAHLRRVAIEDAATAGVFLFSVAEPIPVTLEDVSIANTRPVAGGGWGLYGVSGSNVTARRVLLEGNHMTGMELAGVPGGVLVLEDAVVHDTLPYPGEGVAGRGLSLTHGSTAEVRRTRLEGTYEFGVVGFGSAVRLEDVEVRRTRGAACAARGVCLPFGHAVGAYTDSALQADRFVFSDAASCGVHFAVRSQVDLVNGVVTGTRIGACVQVDGYDVDRLSNDVFYLGNERNLDATELPVPDPGT